MLATSTHVDLAGPADVDAARTLMMRVLAEDLGYGFRPEWHADLADPATAYLHTPGQALFLARDPDGTLLGTTAVKAGGPRSPQLLVDHYAGRPVAQLARVWVLAEHRRRGVARALVHAAARWAVAEGGYRTVYLHTDAAVPGAEAFWRSMPVREVLDERAPGELLQTIHFELDVTALPGNPARPARD
ncbi:Acetyltransferase (GNAT) family protein [Klenkia soli]|uniref:Acetyltransferase (GNAT) family protein n=1 Tax=Klenkia soli TaxID=1052260 RepID=A0A1H0DYU1_9ACTN|nr:GNAT family N-acetyltransferase [Klenkia soli]SDN75312.1 Acetyltransferase (GNAT) family protein [Klenkia soli]